MEKTEDATVLPQPAQPSNSRGESLKQERAFRSRQQILSSAAAAFATGGYSSITIADVAQGAGMTKGAVYFHFANKEALAVAVCETFYDRWSRLYNEVVELGLPPFDALLEFLRRTALLFKSDSTVQAGARLQLEHETMGTQQILPAPFDTYHGLVVKLVAEAHKAGQLRPGSDPASLATVVTAAAFGAQHMSWVQCGWADVLERMDQVITELVIPASSGAQNP